MKTTLLIISLVTFFCCHSASAGGPIKDSANGLSDSLVRVVKNKPARSEKVCSCEIMWLDVGNEQTQIIGVFAEKTAGNAENDSKLLNYYLQKEKKQINHYLTFKILQSRKSFQAGTCRETYSILKAYQKKLHLYSVLDLDILTKVRNKRFIF